MNNARTVTISPFVYRKDYVIKADDSVKEITMGRMCSYQKDRKLLKVHFDILKLFLKYKYLTRHQIEMALHYEKAVLPDETGITIKQAVQFLHKNGIVKRYYFVLENQKNNNNSESDAENESPESDSNDVTDQSVEEDENVDADVDTINEVISCRSVNFYTLTKGSLAYVMSEFRNIEIGEKEEELVRLDPVEDILKMLSIVNFTLVNFDLSKESANFVSNCIYTSGNKKICIDSFATCMVPDGNRLRQNVFCVLSIRKVDKWGKLLISKLNLYSDIFEDKIKMKERKDIPAALLICEDDEQIINCYKEISLQKRAYNFNIFYTTDTRLHNKYLNMYLIYNTWDETSKGLICKEILSPFYVD